MGPYHWGKVSKICAEGKQQSPINIITKDSIALDSKSALEFHESTQAVLSHEVDNGHAVKITPEDDHGISINGEHYKLLQFHFHGRSENYINGRQYDMEMHLVHQNSKGELAVVGVMIEKGAHNRALEDVVSHINGGDLEVATAALLPKDTTHYYHFMGSLTTPPCSENVKWYVMKDTISIDEDQLLAFRKHHYYNFRPLQKLHGRKIQAH
jgi:carbonic anhydrase